MESARNNFDFIHQISYIASPLMVWRLSASTAIWAGNKELQSVQETTDFKIEDFESRLSRINAKEAAEFAKRQAKDELARLAALEEEDRLERTRYSEAVEKSRLESEIAVEGQLNCEEIATSERPAPKDWIKYM